MPQFKAEMDANYQKVIKLRDIKRLFQRGNGEWAIETTGGDFGTPSKQGVKRIIKHRPEIIEEPPPQNALMAWLQNRPDDDEEQVVYDELIEP
jgi:hypothetical protein